MHVCSVWSIATETIEELLPHLFFGTSGVHFPTCTLFSPMISWCGEGDAEFSEDAPIGSALLLLLRGTSAAVRDRGGDDGDLVALAHDALGEVLLDRDGVVVGLDAGVDFLRT